MPDVFAGRAHTFAGGCLSAFAQTPRGDQILPAGATGNIVDCIEPPAAEELAEPGHGLEPRQGLRLMLLGRLQEGECQLLAPLVIRGDERQVDGKGLVHRGIGKAFGHASPVGFGGPLLPARGQGVLTMGLVHMGQQVRAFPPQVGAAAEEVASRTQRRGLAIRLGAQAPAEPEGNVLRIDRIVFGFPAVKGLHRESMAQDTRKARLRTEGSQPIPSKQTLHSHDEALAIGGKGLEKRCRCGFHGAVQ